MGLSTVFCQVECSESSPLSARRTAKARLASSGTIAEQQRLHMKASMAVYFHLHSTSISVIKIKHTDLMVFCQQHVAWCFSGVFCAVRRRLRYCQPISAADFFSSCLRRVSNERLQTRITFVQQSQTFRLSLNVKVLSDLAPNSRNFIKNNSFILQPPPPPQRKHINMK